MLADAVRIVRAALPGAAITGLTHAGHSALMRDQGVDDTVEVPGTRFGALRTPWGTLGALRAARFDAVVIPQMIGSGLGHTNLYGLALATGARRCAVFDPDRGLRWHSRLQLFVEILRQFPAWIRQRVDIPFAVFLMTLGVVWPRRRAREGQRTASPTRVLHIITSWGVGGAQRQLAELVRHTPSDVRCDILVLSRGDGEFSSQHLRGRNIHIQFSRRWPLLAPTILEIAALSRRERYDVVHTWLFLANALGVAGARLGGAPRVVSSVRNLSLWKRTWANRPWFRLADVLSSRGSDVVTVNATALVNDHAAWARMVSDRIRVVPNGLNADGVDVDEHQARSRLRAALHVPIGVRLVGTVGRLAPEKDHEVLLAAWARVASTTPDVHLVIVGDGPLRPTLEARAASGSVPVTFVGEASNARELMAGLDLFVLPSRIEGFANVLLEAAMLGTPILATEVGAARDVIVDDEDLVPVGDVDALAARLTMHLSDLDGCRARASRRRTFVRETFTVDRMVQRWLTLYARS